MTLREYIDEKGLTYSEAARQIGEPYRNIQRYASGTRIPRKRAMDKIKLWSGGKVTAESFYVTEQGAAA